jgi:hypothetical protein
MGKMTMKQKRKVTMFACVIILIVLLPVALLPPVLETFFSANELDEMGICLGHSQAGDPI